MWFVLFTVYPCSSPPPFFFKIYFIWKKFTDRRQKQNGIPCVHWFTPPVATMAGTGSRWNHKPRSLIKVSHVGGKEPKHLDQLQLLFPSQQQRSGSEVELLEHELAPRCCCCRQWFYMVECNASSCCLSLIAIIPAPLLSGLLLALADVSHWQTECERSLLGPVPDRLWFDSCLTALHL